MMGKIEEGSAVGTVVHGYTKVVGKYNSAVCIKLQLDPFDSTAALITKALRSLQACLLLFCLKKR